MIVCIAEKPSVARDIANVLGAKNDRGGFMDVEVVELGTTANDTSAFWHQTQG